MICHFALHFITRCYSHTSHSQSWLARIRQSLSFSIDKCGCGGGGGRGVKLILGSVSVSSLRRWICCTARGSRLIPLLVTKRVVWLSTIDCWSIDSSKG